LSHARILAFKSGAGKTFDRSQNKKIIQNFYQKTRLSNKPSQNKTKFLSLKISKKLYL
jgi:hypothetical protein